jgi:hypothetical protein
MLTDGFGFLKEILGTLKMASFVEIPEHSFSLRMERQMKWGAAAGVLP